jgi:hypothetical protein
MSVLDSPRHAGMRHFGKVALAIVALAVLCLACEFRASAQSGPKEPPAPAFWVTHALKFGGGPYFYATREVIPLPDGTGVVCVATIKDLWCRDAK